MFDVSEYELQKTESRLPRVPPHSATRWIVAAVVLVAAATAVWFFWRAPGTPAPASEPVAVAGQPAAPPPSPAPGPLCEPSGATVPPPTEATDAAVGKLVRALSSHPRVTAWLATDNLVRNFAIVVENIANGQTPAPHLRALRPSGRFRVIDTDDELVADPRSYERYASIAAAVESIDAQAAAQLCATLKPRLEEAYGELGRPEPFEAALERAIAAMLQTPVPPERVPLVPKGAVYAFEDEALEGLKPAQKHLARMGPHNVQVIQAKLRQIARAIGIPPERIPQ